MLNLSANLNLVTSLQSMENCRGYPFSYNLVMMIFCIEIVVLCIVICILIRHILLLVSLSWLVLAFSVVGVGGFSLF